MVHGLETLQSLNEKASSKMTPTQNLQQDHSYLVATLAKPGQSIVDELSTQGAHLLHMTVGISGEAGELLDAIKKHVIYLKPLDLDNIIEELGDLEFYMEGIRAALGVSREETLVSNIEKLTKRYGKNYSNKAAQIRMDKQPSCDPLTEND